MIFTFYSFKGGVGRSMAVAGIANLLAQEGLRVLAIDFDLEAPGLERYFFDGQESRRVRQGPGLIDLLTMYKLALTSEAEFARAEFKQLQKFITEAIPVAGERGGRVDLITSGRREPEAELQKYALAVRTFDWQDFFHNWKGDKFFEWLCRQFYGPDLNYDVVLVDSRTGVTEMGGVCAYQLADVAVMFCAANNQNLEGTLAVANDFQSDGVLALRQGRQLELLIIPARLEENNPHRDEFLDRFKQVFTTLGISKKLTDLGLDYRKLALPYNPEFAVGDPLVGDDSALLDVQTFAGARTEQLFATFARLADALIVLAPPDSTMGKLQGRALARLSGADTSTVQTLIADPTRSFAGYDVFLNASDDDRLRAAELVQHLENAGLRVFFEQDVVAFGENLADSVGRALEYSENLVVVFGKGTRSPWRVDLLKKARAQRRTRVIPVLITKQDSVDSLLGSFGLDTTAAVDLSDWPAEPEFQRLVVLLRSRRGTTVQAADTIEREVYPGPKPFTEDLAGLFFGRDKEADQILTALRDFECVVVTGASGVGKTSLLSAGVVPKVRGRSDLFGQSVPWHIQWIDLSAVPSAAEIGFTQKSATAPVLLVLDGVNSFPLDGHNTARAARFVLVNHLLGNASPARKIVVVGRGALSDVEWKEIRPTLASRACTEVEISKLDEKSLREAIERPAGRQRHLLEPGLTDRLIRDAGAEHSAIGQIQLVMPSLWEKRRRGWVTNKAYEDPATIVEAFHSMRERVLRERSEAFRESANVLFRNLLQFNSELQFVREQKTWAALATVPGIGREDPIALRDTLAGAGLIELWSHKEEGDKEKEELFCALARPEAERYIDAAKARGEDAKFFIWRRQFAALVAAWIEKDRGEASLLSGGALDEAEQALHGNSDGLTGDERSLINESLKQRARLKEAEEQRKREEEERKQELRRANEEREQERREHERKRRRTLWTGVVVFAVLAFTVSLIAYARGEREAADRATTLSLINAYSGSNPTIVAVALREILEKPAADQTALSSIGGWLRGFWDKPIPDQSVVRSITRLVESEMYRAKLTHTGRVLLANFDPSDRDGQTIVTFSNETAPVISNENAAIASNAEGTAVNNENVGRLWAVRTWTRQGRLLTDFRTRSGQIAYATLSPEGQMILTASYGATARLWDRKGKQIAELEGHTAPVVYAAFSLDGRAIVTASFDGTARVWDRHGSPLVALNGHTSPVLYAAFSPDSKTIVTTSVDNTARLWDLQGRMLAVLKGHTGTVGQASFSQDGLKIVTASTDNSARIWDVKGTPQVSLIGHAGAVSSAAFSPDGRTILTASIDNTARLWDLQGKPLANLTGHAGPVSFAAFSQDGETIVTASADKTARLWDRHGTLLMELRGHSGQVTYAGFSPDRQTVVTASTDNTELLWDRQGKLLVEIKSKSGPVGRAAFSPDGAIVLTTTSTDNVVEKFGPKAKLPIQLTKQLTRIDQAQFSPDGQLIVTASMQKPAQLWDRQGKLLHELAPTPENTSGLWDREGKLLKILEGHEGPVTYAAFSPDGRAIVTASIDTTPRLWDRQGKLLAELKGHTLPVSHVAFSPDGRTIITASYDGTARLWDSQGTPLAAPLEGHTGPISDAAFSPDGRKIVTASFDITAANFDTTPRLWDRRGKPLRELTGHTSPVSHVGFSPDGQKIITASYDGTARLWDSQGNPLAALIGHSGPVEYAVFSPDGHTIATASSDATARLWDAEKGRLLAELKGHTRSVSQAMFSPDGKTIITASFDATARLWPISAETFVDRIGAIAIPCLAAEERSPFFPSETSKKAEEKERACLEKRNAAQQK